jgi:uncharacterized phiE125 gp8 family phage protein
MNPQTTVTAKSSDLPVTLEEAKTHLRLLSSDLDEHVASLLEAAVEYCETVCGRSLRVSHTLTQKYDGWPLTVHFDRHPVTAITSVTYYDDDDATQTVSSSNYRLIASSEAAAFLEFDDDFTLPTLSDRSDAVIVTYTAGYATLADVPHRAKAAINMKLAELFGNLDERMVAPNERAIASLLGTLDWGCYR